MCVLFCSPECVWTHEVVSGAQAVQTLFLQQALQQRPGAAGGARTHHQRFVQDVVVHLVCVSAVEGGLKRKECKGRGGNQEVIRRLVIEHRFRVRVSLCLCPLVLHVF